MRDIASSGSTDDEAGKRIIIQEAKRNFKSLTGTNHPWYVWDWNKEIDYENCTQEATADHLAEMLIDLRNSLAEQLNS
jgi:hypothetical protein